MADGVERMPPLLERTAFVMSPLSKLLLRLVLSILLAFLIGRFFFHGAFIVKSLALAAVMVVLAYLFESTKKSDKGEKNGT